jgi:hypothetical protein
LNQIGFYLQRFSNKNRKRKGKRIRKKERGPPAVLSPGSKNGPQPNSTPPAADKVTPHVIPPSEFETNTASSWKISDDSSLFWYDFLPLVHAKVPI